MSDTPRQRARPQPYPVDTGSRSSVGNWLTRGLAAIAGAVVLVATLFVGVVMFFVMLGFFAVIAAAVLFKVWSMKRRFQKQASGGESAYQDTSDGSRGWMQTEYVVMRHRNGKPEYHRHVSRRELGGQGQTITGEHDRLDEDRNDRGR